MIKASKLSGLEKRIEEYFDRCDAINEENSKKIAKPYTMSGLLFHIGLSKHEFEELLSNKKYAEILKSAKSRIEAFIEEKALSGELSNNASQGSLKYYFGWGEKEKNENETEECKIFITMSDEARELSQ